MDTLVPIPIKALSDLLIATYHTALDTYRPEVAYDGDDEDAYIPEEHACGKIVQEIDYLHVTQDNLHELCKLIVGHIITSELQELRADCFNINRLLTWAELGSQTNGNLTDIKYV